MRPAGGTPACARDQKGNPKGKPLDLQTTRSLIQPPPGLLEDASLLLDFDGTMVEMAPRPDAVVVDQALRELVGTLHDHLQGRIAFVSGRDVATLDRLLGMPDLAIAGSHGLEIRHRGGRIERPERPADLDRAVARMRAFADEQPGVLVEDKPLGAALHYRLAPQAERQAMALARQLAEDTGLVLQTGKMVAELRLGGGDKGRAVARLMDEPGLAGGTPLFLGDDDTDEPGFAAAARLGGSGVLVGAPRETAAAYHLPGVGAVHDWLRGEIAR